MSHFCRQETLSGWPGGVRAQVAGCLGPSLALSFELHCCDSLFIHHLLSACCLLSMVAHLGSPQ